MHFAIRGPTTSTWNWSMLPSQLRILVRDDGCGIDPQVLKSGRDGHWGLAGMRERAKRIGAKFRVLSRTQGGTEVELRVPSDIAFESDPSTSASRWFTWRYPAKTQGEEPVGKKRGG